MARKVELVVNPASGSRLAVSLVETHVQPLLVSSLPPDAAADVRVWQTQSAGDAVRIGTEIAREHLATATPQIDIVVIGGDGTTHELLNGLYPRSLPGDEPAPRAGPMGVRLAIVPGGTANALYSALYPNEWTQDVQQAAATAKSAADIPETVLRVMLRSVHSLASSLKQSSQTAAKEGLWELPLMRNTLTSTDGGEREVVSHLVTSHALHAAILHDADTPTMRAQYAGIERFKIAAQQNATRWTSGTVVLHPLPSGGVLRYAPRSKAFEPFPPEKQGGEVVVEGPFLYLNAMVTDRLESAFVPAPLSSAFRGEELPRDAVDVVLIRPLRDPQIHTGDKDGGMRFATTRLGEITTGMYSGGTHIDLTYDSGETMVEYFRCSGYEFTPSKGEGSTEEEDRARLVCTDGYISSASRVSVQRWTGEEGGDAELAAPLVWR